MSNPRRHQVKACATLLLNVSLFLHQPYTEEQLKGTDVGGRSSSPSGGLVWEKTQKNPRADEVHPKGTEPHPFSAEIPTKSRVSGVTAQPFLHINGQAPPDAAPDLVDLVPACHLEPRRGSPKFITLLAPLGVGSSHVSQAGGGVRRSINVNTVPSSGHEEPRLRRPTSDGIGVKPSVEGEALTRIKDTNEDVPPEGRLDLDGAQRFFTDRKTTIEDIHAFSRELSNLSVVPGDRFVISEEKRRAVFTLDLDDPFVPSPLPASTKSEKRGKADKMPHKTHKSTTESKARPKKEKPAGHQCGPQASKKEDPLLHRVSAQPACNQQESQIVSEEKHSSPSAPAGCEDKEPKPLAEIAEKASSKPPGKKKKKHGQHATGARSVGEPPAEADNGAKPKTTKGRVDMFEAKLGSRAGSVHKDSDRSEKKSLKAEAKPPKDQPSHHTGHKDHQPKSFSSPLNDEIKRRRLSGDKFGKMVGVLESKPAKPAPPHQEKREEPKADGGAPKKAYSDVVKQKSAPKEGKKHTQPLPERKTLSG